MRILIIHNLKAGTGGDDIFHFMKGFLEQNGYETVLRSITAGESVDELIADAEDFDRVVVSGGDGTVAHVTYKLMNRNVPTLIFPSGTANLLATNLGNAPEPIALAKATVKGITSNFDMGVLNFVDETGAPQTRGFSMIAGAGYDATIMNDAVGLKETLGFLSYFAAALANPTPKKVSFTLELDDKTVTTEGIAVLVVNFSTLPFDMDIIADADAQDGYFDVVVVKPSMTAALLPTIVSALIDNKGSFPYRPQLETYRTKKVTVTSDPKVNLQYDGEFIANGQTPFSAEIKPGASCLIVDELSPYYPKDAH